MPESPDLTESVFAAALALANPADSLKPREHEVFLLVAAGMANKQIAIRLGVSLQTVKLHRGRLMRKLQLHSVAELVRLGERAGAIQPRP